MNDIDREIEQFPVVKRQIRYEEPPELIFFDVDEDPEEAEFIRIDDLFAMETEGGEKLSGLLAFTLFPRKKGDYITGRLSRFIHRTLILTSVRLQRPLEKVRIRPEFAQWQLELEEEDEPEQLAGEFRDDLEVLLGSLKNGKDLFWSENCFVCPVSKEIPDDVITRVAATYQKQPD